MIELFNIFLYRPLVNILIFIYQVIPGNDFGIAIIILTGLVRMILYPVSAKGIRAQRILNNIQPEIKDLQKKYKEDKEKQVKETLALYKKHKTSPFSGFLPLLIQLPIMIALYRIFSGIQTVDLASVLYSFVPYPGEINFFFLGLMDLTKIGITETNGYTTLLFGNIIIIIGAAVAQLFQMKMVMAQKPTGNKKAKVDPKTEMANKIQKKMIYFSPLFTMFIMARLPIAVGLYWFASTSFSIIQQHFILKKYD